MSKNNITDELRNALEKLGAREHEIAALSMAPERGFAALLYAQKKGADRPIAYAISLFDNPEWHPSGETQRRGTNLSARSRLPSWPPPQPQENLARARELMERMGWK